MEHIQNLPALLSKFETWQLDCFMAGWNSHRAGQPNIEEEGYNVHRFGWNNRERVVTFEQSKNL